MVAIKDCEMPIACDWCIIRTRCDWYTAWIHGVRHVSPPKPEGEECRLIDLEQQEQDRWRPCNEKPEYDFQNVLVRWHDKRKGCEKDYYIFEGYVVREIWCGLFEDADISDFEPIEWKPLEPYTEDKA